MKLDVHVVFNGDNDRFICIYMLIVLYQRETKKIEMQVLLMITVKPVLRDHLWDKEKTVF
jgi:hypothetical protein